MENEDKDNEDKENVKEIIEFLIEELSWMKIQLEEMREKGRK